MEDSIKNELKGLSEKTGMELGEVEKIFEDELASVKEIGIDGESARSLAMKRVNNSFKKRINQGIEDIELIVVGMSRPNEWATNIRKNIDKVIKEKSKDAAMLEGLIDDNGNYLYPQTDQWRKGKKVPHLDCSVTYYGITESKNKIIPVEVSVKKSVYSITAKEGETIEGAVERIKGEIFKDITSKIPIRADIKISARKSTNKSTEKLLVYSLQGDNVTTVRTLTPDKMEKVCDTAFASAKVIDCDKNFNELMAMESSTERTSVVLKNFLVQQIRKDVGQNKSVEITLDTPDFDKYVQIRVYLPKNGDVEIMEGMPVNIYCEISGFNPERKQISANGVAYWLPAVIAGKITGVKKPVEIKTDGNAKNW